jgi:hypothetical protein
MQIKKKINNPNKLYIIFFSFVLFIIIIFSTSSNASSFKISNLEISEPFELNFNKEKVVEKGFTEAFNELISMITTSGDKKKIENISLATIKSFIDSFTMSNERFINNKYHAKFNVNFNKKNVLSFFERENIFPSIPKKKNLLIIPVLVDLQLDQILLFTNNIFYERWNGNKERYYLLNYILPAEDIEDVGLLVQNSKSIEDYNFIRTIQKYDLEDFVIAIIYKNLDELRILSKIQLNETYKIDNQKFNKIDLSKESDVDFILTSLKVTYENYWKNINQINTSIKLSLTISINANEHNKIKFFENTLNELDLVSNFKILKLNNINIYYKIVYNGSPNKFINEIKSKGIDLDTQSQIWKVQ